MRSRERSMANAAPMRSLSSTPLLLIIASSIAIWLGVMKTESSPGSLKSTCAASSVSVASEVSPPAASIAAAIGGIGILPGDHEHGVPLLDEEAHQRISRREVENVVLHDPCWGDQDRLGV